MDNINTPAAQQWISIFHEQNYAITAVSKSSSKTAGPPPYLIRNNESCSMQQKFQTNRQMAQINPQTPPLNKHSPMIMTEDMPNLSYPAKSTYSDNYINRQRQVIHDTINVSYLGGNANFESMPDILGQLFELYDELFLRRKISEIIARDNIRIWFNYNDKLTKTGGCCNKDGNIYNIQLSQPVILGTFRHNEKAHVSNGLQCCDRLACLMNVFEHELIHFIVEITHGHIKGNNIYKTHGLYFQQLMRGFFGHTEFRHSLTKNIDKPGKRDDFKLADFVSYESIDREIVTGIISKLNPKRAVIGRMTVPYTMLRHATKEEIYKYNKIVDKIPTPVINQYRLNIGDIVSSEIKGKIITGRINRINPKTYAFDQYKVSKEIVRLATTEEKARFLLSAAAIPEKTCNDFYQGQNVKFTHSKTGQVITGIIKKLNPTRAVIEQYTVPYAMLYPM